MARSVSPPRSKAAARTTPKPPQVTAKSKLGPVAPEKLEFTRTPGSRERGGAPGGEAWVISVEGKRAGIAYINLVKDDVRGRHASFHVFLNRPSQGRQIGRRAYAYCCQNSQYRVIYAHMRKSNLASRKAAEYAGFIAAPAPGDSQLVLVWYRDTTRATKPECADVSSGMHGKGAHEHVTQTQPSIVKSFNEVPVSSVELQFDEKNSDVIVWNGQVVMSRTEEAYFEMLFSRLAYLNPRTVLEIGYGLGISAKLIQQYLKPERHDIFEIESSIYQDLLAFSQRHPSVQPFCGDWNRCRIEEHYDFIFFDPFDYHMEEGDEVDGPQRELDQRACRALKMRALLSSSGVLCHPHFGDGDVPELPGFTTVIVERMKVSPIRMADETLCEDVAIVYHKPIAG
ncbi:GNAT family N-acetyltransferase [Pseudomonas cichorii]|nr:GNAT family N-acetyltransferase [Pseudomonas cichorii]MBX8578874.1 GNAT family N-acetyltransferase [Pseudomonas cichorii]